MNIPTLDEIKALQSYDEFIAMGQTLTGYELEINWALGVLGLHASRRYGEANIKDMAGSIGVSASKLYSDIAMVSFYGDEALGTLQAYDNLRLGHFRAAFTTLREYESMALVWQELDHASDNTLSVSDFQAYLLNKHRDKPRFSVYQFTSHAESIAMIEQCWRNGDSFEVTVKVMEGVRA